MPTTEIDGIATRYETVGSGTPLLMFSPGGFDSNLESWSNVGIYRRLRMVEQLAERHTCVLFDRRESGRSGGRVERIGWASYVSQARGLMDHLGLDRAHLMGGCVGCSSVASLAVAHPERVLSMVLFSPAGGVTYRRKQHERFVRHLGYVAEHGLAGVRELALSHADGFSKDPRVGPWVTVLRTDPGFAESYVGLDPARYTTTVMGMARLLFDRDTVPGPEPEDLMMLDVPALVVPGEDASHAPSAARYLQECLPLADYWDVPVAEQTDTTAPTRVLDFLARQD
jgi:pimeloyl-ACP methyl ester carboxylesterase